MNVREIHNEKKEVSAKAIFQTSNSTVTAIQIVENGLLKKHITKTPALLLCVGGSITYEDEKGNKVEMKSGDFYEIEPMVNHWLRGLEKSQLLLVK